MFFGFWPGIFSSAKGCPTPEGQIFCSNRQKYLSKQQILFFLRADFFRNQTFFVQPTNLFFPTDKKKFQPTKQFSNRQNLVPNQQKFFSNRQKKPNQFFFPPDNFFFPPAIFFSPKKTFFSNRQKKSEATKIISNRKILFSN